MLVVVAVTLPEDQCGVLAVYWSSKMAGKSPNQMEVDSWENDIFIYDYICII